MCLGVFIASDKPLSLVPWDAQTPGFNTTPLSGPEENVRQQFSLPEIVYAGAHTRCSCGFRSDRDDPPAVIRSREALVAYLREAARAGPVEVFVCWEGDYAKAALLQSERSVASLAGGDDWLEELTFTRITPFAA
jgi:hypothetical protein